MNRLIILGNGFDLAHELPTQYRDFINHYLSSIYKTNHEDELLSFERTAESQIPPNYVTFEDKLKYFMTWYGSYRFHENSYKFNHHGAEIKFVNDFFAKLYTSNKALNWVDIEQEYFNHLLSLVHTKYAQHDKIFKLNFEMDVIKRYFEQYLEDVVQPMIPNCYNESFEEIINPFVYDENKYLREFPASLKQKLVDVLYKQDATHAKGYYKTVILNFNYTDTFKKLYFDSLPPNSKIINIHGEIGSKTNSLNLGFGDEMHDKYKLIEDLNFNECLRLMKSFAYSNTSNYKELFDFAESTNFQIYIMGHSCGLSDRTLLNTLFEHKNCVSIKPFYHQWEDKSGEKKDNYVDLIQNISRHFNKKAQMREKIVNKEYCVPLPQLTI